MLGSIVLLMCVAASVAAIAILFILYGPVPVRRKVTIIPRIAAPDPFVDQPAARMIGLPQPAMSPIAPQVPVSMHDVAAQVTHAHAARATDAAPAGSFTRARTPSPSGANTIPVPTTPRAKSSPNVAPLTLRRPGNPNPPPLSRARAARGTEPRPRPSSDELAVLDDQTAQVEMLDATDDTFMEDGR